MSIFENITDLELLKRKAQREVKMVLKPFTVTKDEHFVMIDSIRERYYPNFPDGGWETEEKAELALSLWKVNPEKFKYYEKLYPFVTFIFNGLQ